jgi:hypothetical protein
VYIEYKDSVCKGCNETKLIVYKAGCLCCYCNAKRKAKSRKPIKPVSKRGAKVIKKDTEFYESIWNDRPHFCEECGTFLGSSWERIYFSHILTKGAYPELRWYKSNINLLCPKHHREWETGNKKGMSIYVKNRKTIQKLKYGNSTL